MKKKKRFQMFLPIVLLFFLCIPAWGQTESDEDRWGLLQEQTELSGAEDLAETLPQETKEQLIKWDLEQPDPQKILSLTPKQLWEYGKELVLRAVKAPVALLGVLTAVILLCAAAEALKSGFHADGITRVFGAVSSMCIASAVLKPVCGCIERAAQIIRDSAAFLNGFIPVFCGIITASGQPVTAGTYHLLLFGASQMISQTVSQLLLPLIGVFLAISFTAAAVPQLSLDKIAAAMKKAVNWSLGLMLTVYVGLLSLQSMVATGADTLTVKTAKFVTSSFVPVIGSALSDAMLTAQACLKMLRTSVGVYGILAAVITYLPLLLEILCWYLSMQAAALIASLAGSDGQAKLMGALSDALGLLLSITLLFGLLFIISTAVMLFIGMGG